MQPPRWAQKLIETYGHPDTLEEVQGDLLELYAYWVETVGKRRANWRYTQCAEIVAATGETEKTALFKTGIPDHL
ncbi:permease prefix domain 2-containing transporter [Spirosoma pollinicola]|uniref:Uncharacterized protein n=1 Tax=Spirosoma pollinicola TaxID=2057025 RepID=A0A2K8YSL6_9BACT|nr:permease prefix domain 2-containing transporter [Spirosoma pollinicola]AUD00621.1 hypothetical protein CWM47_01580 [Spirosoma pollinicola]